MSFAKGLNLLSLAIAVGALLAWFMDASVWLGAGIGVVYLVYYLFKKDKDDDSSSGIDASDVLDVFDGD